MEVEKRRSKGGFLNLFDWNGRSRKKLFSNNSELPEGLKRGEENAENVSKSWFNRVEVDDNEASSSNKGSGDYNCASSVTDDEGGGARAPGVVARLMGLDTLPASNVTEPCSTPSLDSCSYRPSFYDRSNPNLGSDYHLVDFMNVPNKLEKSSWNTIGARAQKHQNRPFERFQSETLPPKLAKSIPITHHRLLSPIKSPGFIPTKNVAFIMEAAAKIIDANPQASTKNKASSLGSSSVPLRIRDLKQKLEAGHRTSRPERFKGPSSVKYKSGHSNDGSSNGSEYKSFTNLKKSGSGNVKNKGKLVSLAVQAKVNVEKRNGSTSSSNRTFMNQKEKNDVKSNQSSKNLPSMQRSEQKRTFANRTSNVLRQNNQKQNSLSNNDNSSSKTSVSNQLTRTRSSNGSVGPNKTVNKVVVNSETGAKMLSSVAIPTGKEFPLSTRMKVPLKKMPVSGEVRLRKSLIDVSLLNNDESSRKCNVAIDGCTSWGADNMKQGMDVISFTFTSPLRKSRLETNSSSCVMGINNHIGNDSFADSDQPLLSNFKLSSPGLNAIGGDALSVLLEQKLQELRHRVDSSHCNLIREGTSADLVSGFQDSDPSVMSSKSREENKRLQFDLLRHKLDSLYDLDGSSLDDMVQNVNRQWQGSEWMEVHSSCSNNSATGEELDCLNPRPASSFEHSFVSESVPDNSQSTIESTKYLLEQAQESSNWHSTNESLQVGGEIELSDSACSVSTMDMSRKHASRTFSLMGCMGSSNWELDYVRDILNNAELMLEDFALGQTGRVLAPNLFDQLENQGNGSERNGEEYYKLGRYYFKDLTDSSKHRDLKQATSPGMDITRRTHDELGTRWPFFVFLSGSMFCLLSSSICHLFSCHSHHVNLLLLRVDYVGITIMIITSFFPPIYYIFQCDPHWQFVYLGGITAMGMFTIATLLSPTLSSGKCRAFRALLFSSMGLFGIIPAIHAVVVNWRNPQRNATLAYESAMAVSYLTGALFYVSRIPERWKPGWFDLAGHSHQIFHVLVVMGALAHYGASLLILDSQDTITCG